MPVYQHLAVCECCKYFSLQVQKTTWWWCFRTTRLLKSASPSTGWGRSSDLSLSTIMFLHFNPVFLTHIWSKTTVKRQSLTKSTVWYLMLWVCCIEKCSHKKASGWFLFACLWLSGRPTGGESALSKQERRATYPTATWQKCTTGE